MLTVNNLQRAALLTSFWRHRLTNLPRTVLLTSLVQYDKDSFRISSTASGYACGFNQSETVRRRTKSEMAKLLQDRGKYFEWMIKQLLNSAVVGCEEFLLGLWPRWITPFLLCRILHILRQPNSITAKYSPILRTARVAKNIWRLINTIASDFWCWTKEKRAWFVFFQIKKPRLRERQF